MEKYTYLVKLETVVKIWLIKVGEGESKVYDSDFLNVTGFSTKIHLFSQHNLHWATNTSFKVSPYFRLLPYNNFYRTSQNGCLMVRSFHLWNEISLRRAISSHLETDISQWELNPENRADEEAFRFFCSNRRWCLATSRSQVIIQNRNP